VAGGKSGGESDHNQLRNAKDQTTLVYLLQSLHLLFGITGLIGVIVCHTKSSTTADTVYESHRIWQIWTFWAGLIGYAAGFYYLNRSGSWVILLVTVIWFYYRIINGWLKARAETEIIPGRIH